MTAIPATFRAFVAGQDAGAFGRRVRRFDESALPPGEVEIRVTWSCVNYKDGLASIASGRVARIDPLIPGIDLAGEVVGSTADVPVGSQVIAHAYDLGVSRHGGFAEYQRVPAAWIVPLPSGLTPRLSMALGTAGFTAAQAVIELERRGLAPGQGPVLVTGASGGVGTVAVGILAARGYETWALTGKPDEATRLRGLGAAGILAREDAAGDSPRPLESERWSGVVDTVGGATLPWALRTVASGGTVVACGNAGGAALATTVFPFILRGAALVGINSVPVPIAERCATWERLATDLRPNGLGEGLTEVDLDGLSTALDGILAGQARGRWIVRIGDELPGAR